MYLFLLSANGGDDYILIVVMYTGWSVYNLRFLAKFRSTHGSRLLNDFYQCGT